MQSMKNLLALRSHREADAQAALQAQRKTCVQASAARDAAANALEAFTQMASERETRLANALLGRTVRLQEIAEFNRQVADLRQEAGVLAQTLDQATQTRDGELLALRKCEVAHVAAWRQEQKWASLVSHESSRLAQMLEVRQEQEIDEARGRSGHAGDLEAGWRIAND